MKKFFSLYHFRELRILLSLEFIVATLLLIIFQQQGIPIAFSTSALVASLICYSIAAVVDPERYFNFFTLVAIGIFGYGVWWFAFTMLSI
jgi:hypothetical protein